MTPAAPRTGRPNLSAQKRRLKNSGLLEDRVYAWGQWNSKYETRFHIGPIQSESLFAVCLREEGGAREYDPVVAEEVGKETANFIVHSARDLADCHTYIAALEAEVKRLQKRAA